MSKLTNAAELFVKMQLKINGKDGTMVSPASEKMQEYFKKMYSNIAIFNKNFKEKSDYLFPISDERKKKASKSTQNVDWIW